MLTVPRASLRQFLSRTPGSQSCRRLHAHRRRNLHVELHFCQGRLPVAKCHHGDQGPDGGSGAAGTGNVQVGRRQCVGTVVVGQQSQSDFEKKKQRKDNRTKKVPNIVIVPLMNQYKSSMYGYFCHLVPSFSPPAIQCEHAVPER